MMRKDAVQCGEWGAGMGPALGTLLNSCGSSHTTARGERSGKRKHVTGNIWATHTSLELISIFFFVKYVIS